MLNPAYVPTLSDKNSIVIWEQEYTFRGYGVTVPQYWYSTADGSP